MQTLATFGGVVTKAAGHQKHISGHINEFPVQSDETIYSENVRECTCF